MKSNGHGKNGHTTLDANAPDIVQSVIDAEYGKPIPKFADFNKARDGKNTKAFKWYSVQPWDEWWDDFSTALDPLGKPKYRSAYHFSKVKTSNNWQQKLLYEMIGPEPGAEQNRRVPWLGDWDKRRSMGFWAIDPNKMASIKAAIQERKDALEYLQAFVPILLPHMQRWHRLTEMIDAAFNGQPYDPKLSPTHPKNKARVREYIALQKAAFAMIRQAQEAYGKCHGVDVNNADAFVQMLGLVGLGAVAGAVANQQLPSNQQSQWTRLLAESIQDKVDMYPGLTLPDPTSVEGEKQKKTKPV